MNHKITLIGTVLAAMAISVPFVISETSPKPQQLDCELSENFTRDELESLIEMGCAIDASPDIWDDAPAWSVNWTENEN